MSGLDTWWAYEEFAEAIQRNRFVLTQRMSGFLAALRESTDARAYLLPKGSELWRAQLGCVERAQPAGDPYRKVTVSPHPAERMVPDPKFVKVGGRANPPGVAYMYLAESGRTAVAEARPWVGAWVTLAKFAARRDLRLLDLTVHSAVPQSDVTTSRPPAPEEVANVVWGRINTAFATPVSPQDSQLEYLPTQYLAEFFRELGFDGLIFYSALADCRNITLYGLDDAALVERVLLRVEGVEWECSVAGEPVEPRYRLVGPLPQSPGGHGPKDH